MKKNRRNAILIFLAAAMVFSCAVPVLAALEYRLETVEVGYRDIDIIIDGETMVPTDVNGNVVEPHLIEGTTYVPIRGLSELLGYNVEWVGGDINNVIVSSIPDEDEDPGLNEGPDTEPSAEPSATPSAEPSAEPSAAPSAEPSTEPKTDEGTYELQVGASVKDVTPQALPVTGVARQSLGYVIEPIHVRVMAFDDSNGGTALMVVWEMGEGPAVNQFVQALSDHTGIPYDNIFYGATHAHSGPSLANGEVDYSIPDDEATNDQLWLRYAYEQMLEAADEALASLQPATVGIGYSDCYINVNRNQYYTDQNGEIINRTQGYDFTGVNDNTVATIRFDDMDGEPIAFIVHYAVHAVTMYANTVTLEDGTVVNGIHSDIPGFVSTTLEDAYDDTVAVWISGAAGDINPILGNEYFTPNTETGAQETGTFDDYTSGDTIVQVLGKIHYDAVRAALRDIDETTSDARVSTAYDYTEIPAYVDGNDDFQVHLRLLRIGDIALLGYGGELFCSYGLEMKESSPMEHTLVSNHFLSYYGTEPASYMPDDYGIENGGQGATNLRYKAGYMSGALIGLMNDLIDESYS